MSFYRIFRAGWKRARADFAVPLVLWLGLNSACVPRGTWTERTAHLDHFMEIDGRRDRRVFYRISGRGDARLTLVLIHGLGCSRASWLPLHEALEREFRVLSIDLIGHGASDKPAQFDYSMSRQADVVRQVIDSVEPGEFALLGTSYGGGIALEAALLLRDRAGFRGVAAIGAPALDFPPPGDSKLAQDPLLRAILVWLVDPTDLATRILARSYHRDERIRPELRDEFAYNLRSHEARRAAVDAGAEVLREVRARSDERRYARINRPLLLIWGDHDRIVPIDVMQRLLTIVPGATGAVIEDCGHITAEECPEATLGALLPFLRGL